MSTAAKIVTCLWALIVAVPANAASMENERQCAALAKDVWVQKGGEKPNPPLYGYTSHYSDVKQACLLLVHFSARGYLEEDLHDLNHGGISAPSLAYYMSINNSETRFDECLIESEICNSFQEFRKYVDGLMSQ